jgi:hypothetical protein
VGAPDGEFAIELVGGGVRGELFGKLLKRLIVSARGESKSGVSLIPKCDLAFGDRGTAEGVEADRVERAQMPPWDRQSSIGENLSRGPGVGNH